MYEKTPTWMLKIRWILRDPWPGYWGPLYNELVRRGVFVKDNNPNRVESR